MFPGRIDRPAAHRGLTLVEMLITVFLIGVGLFLLVGWSRTVREGAKRRLAATSLRMLDRALADYRAASGDFPPAPGDDALAAVQALLRLPATRKPLEALPESLWTPERPRRLLDPWGTPLRYLCDPRRNAWVRANGGRPVFVSAGADREWGTLDSAGTGDNLRSDDPDDAGFAE
ncbi:MAG: type II secretion system protein [Phycisphaerae bacterium]